jgi:phosphatidylserine/phosphatidylglycerophosphate/cardiolipin synthase-like enzyme
MVMVLSCDRNGTRMVDELIKAKNRGVDVKMMHEGVWSKIINAKCVKKMRNGGIDVLLPSDMISNHFALGVVHNKFWIRDGEEAIIGGQNMVDGETEATGFNHKMIDADVWIHSGPEVTTLLNQYANLWYQYSKKDQRARIAMYRAEAKRRIQEEREQGVRGSDHYEKWFSNTDTRMKGVCRSVVQKYGKVDLIGPVLQKYAEEAKSRIMATTPNLKYHNSRKKPVINNLLNALTNRANNGVTVDVISNGIDGASGALGDTLREAIKKAKSRRSTWWQVPILNTLYHTSGVLVAKGDGKQFRKFQGTSSNIRGWMHSGGIHAKQMVFDRTMVAVGSFNLDYHSAQANHEAEIFCLDEKLANQVEREFAINFANSVPLPR